MTELERQITLLEEIKRLTILDHLLKNFQPTEITNVLGVNKSTLSRLFPAKTIRK